MAELFAALEEAALKDAREEGFAPSSVKLTRLLDLRYPHQGYTLAVECPDGLDRAAIKASFDALHGRVYGQSAPREDAEIVTFRVQAEIEVPRFLPKRLNAWRRQRRARSTWRAAALRSRARPVRPGHDL